MNIRENLIFRLLAISLLIVTTNASSIESCNRSCPSCFGYKQVPYPFGCSAGCEIPLNCTEDAGVFIGEFPVHSIDLDSIRISLQSSCNRPLTTLHQLYSNHYAPTSRNALLLRNCMDDQTHSSCMIPSVQVEARFQAPESCKNTSLSCYAESEKNAIFLEYRNMEKKDCKFLLSSLSAQILNGSQGPPSVTLDVEVAELGWWMPGRCDCDTHASCINVSTPNGSKGYRCNCTEGFHGDGFRAGFGCRKELGLERTMNEEDKVLARKMVIVSLWYIQTDPSNRPSMKQVIEMLQGSADSLQIPPKPYLSSPKSPKLQIPPLH